MTNQLTATIVWLLLLFGLMYFFTIRPQQKQQKEFRDMIAKLKKGDKIITIGGFHGTITDIKDQTVIVRLADKVEVELQKSGIRMVLGKKND